MAELLGPLKIFVGADDKLKFCIDIQRGEIFSVEPSGLAAVWGFYVNHFLYSRIDFGTGKYPHWFLRTLDSLDRRAFSSEDGCLFGAGVLRR